VIYVSIMYLVYTLSLHDALPICYDEVRGKLANGEIRSIDDFITYNLNIRRFAQDILETTESTDLLDAFWKALTSISILDPTVGRSEEHTSELQSRENLVCRLLLE